MAKKKVTKEDINVKNEEKETVVYENINTVEKDIVDDVVKETVYGQNVEDDMLVMAEVKVDESKEEVIEDVVEDVVKEDAKTVVVEETTVVEEKIIEVLEKAEEPVKKVNNRNSRFTFGYIWNGQEFDF